MVDLSKLQYYSELNYMKRSDTFGQDTLAYSTYYPGANLTESHGLGYVPFFLAGVDLFGDGVIWSNQYVHPFTQTSNSGFANEPPQFYVWANETNIIINMRDGLGTGDQSGSRNIYYGVYLDYA